MVDPHNITNYNHTTAELEEKLLFCVSVAGKTAVIIARKIDEFLKECDASGFHGSPFEKIRQSGTELSYLLKKTKLGKYALLTKTFSLLARSGIDLRTCTVDDLETFPGIGPKTSRFFVLHTRADQQLAVLDTHILAHLRELGHSAPKMAPSLKRYGELERIVLLLAQQSGLSVAEYDLMIWKQRTKTTPLLIAAELTT